MTRISILILSIFTISSALAATKIIYGEDNRLDNYEVNNNMFLELAKSTAVMVKKNNVIKKNGEYSFKKAKTLKESMSLCKDERYANQINPGYCSGFLVGEDLLVTAGHCIKSESDCKKYSWIFDFKLDHEDDDAKTGDASDVYECAEVVERKLSVFWGKNDYALIKLKRKTDREPLEFNTDKVSSKAKLVVIGHPSGLPQKIADGATVRSKEKDYFVTDLDTFGGNSGSAVFNADTGKVEGILVRGDRDYVKKNGCTVANRVGQDEANGEEVTYIRNIKTLRGIPDWWPF